MARIDVIMPQMGESIAEGTLSRWMKKVGDPIKRDEPMFEISTDKVDAEIPAPNAGVLAEILVQEGQTVAVQTVVARIETDAGAEVAPAPAAAPAAPAPAAAPAPTPAPSAAPAASPPAPPAPAAAAPAAPRGDESLEDRLKTRSTPLVRRMAAEHNVDISAIAGTGMAGRVTKQDLLQHLESAPAPAAAAAPRAPAAGAPAAAPAGVHVIPGPVVEPWEGDTVEPWSRIRKLTADHMIMSRRVSAHVASLIEIDYSHIAGLRKKWKAEFAGRGVNLTYLAFIAKAVADNLRKHKVVNAAVSGESTVFRRDINLGIAVALDWGLIVPVIRHADELSLLGIARSINDLAERARGKKLSPDEVQKGTFTITNPGVFGTLVGLPVINQPQSAILAVGAITKQPAVVTAADGSDAIAIRTRGTLAMSYDHRIVDGSDADRFLADLRISLEQFPDSVA